MKLVKLHIGLFFLVIMRITSFSQNETTSAEGFFDAILNTNFKSVVSSSFLIENNKPKDYYAPQKAFDNDNSTAWVEGVVGDGVNEYIIFPINIKGSRYDQKPAKLKFKIVNGFAKNDKLYYFNNRIKTAVLEIYEAPITIMTDADISKKRHEYKYIRLSNVILNSRVILDIKDIRTPQLFELLFTSKHKPAEGERVYGCIGKLVIKDIYVGSKMRDTCISEINITGSSK